MLTQILN